MRSPPHLPLGGRHLGNKMSSRLRELASHQYQCLIWTTISNSRVQITAAQRNTGPKQKNSLSLIYISPPSLSLSLLPSHSTSLMRDRVMCGGTATFHHFDVGAGPQKYSPYVTVPVIRQTGPGEGTRDGCVCPRQHGVYACAF